jgi:NADH:ubiquinone oxidoreductase subunit 5 (subunit L)/multisubunit Na+/H+ antiporter MnhA subunit
MEGPTPVSALIHAATMVTAGVFLLIRCSPLLAYAGNVLIGMTILGAVTALFSATVGLVQNDIKRVIAYSTCSQLGYMVMIAGLTQRLPFLYMVMTVASLALMGIPFLTGFYSKDVILEAAFVKGDMTSLFAY